MLKRLCIALVALLLVAAPASTPALAKAPLDAFSDMAPIRSATLSPDGQKLAYINRIDDEDYLLLYDFQTRESKALAAIGEIRARSVRFIHDNYIVLVASRKASAYGYRGTWENSNAFSVNLETGKVVRLLTRTDGLYPAQSGLGQIIAVDPGGEHVYMPAFGSDTGADPRREVFRVNLESGHGRRQIKGRPRSTTIDWIVEPDGTPIMREDFNERAQKHTVHTYDGSKTNTIFEEETDLLTRGIVGVSEDGKDLMVIDNVDTDFSAMYRMSRSDGSLSEPIFQRDDKDIASVVINENRVVLGVSYTGMYPTYEMFDEEFSKAIASAQENLPGAVSLIDFSDDKMRILLFASGGLETGRYYLFDRKTGDLSAVAQTRPGIAKENIGEVMTIEYKARDGLTIPSVLTWPIGTSEETRKNLPTIILPHGGPASYDRVGFDWLAQFFANEGYLVLQPNFRGSAGFGASFRHAGDKEWGRKMQDDVTDGAKALQTMGWSDPEKTCIAGWSYGGYAALAGGAITPDLYKCVIAIAGVSDLRKMIAHETRTHGSRSRTVSYWKSVIGDPSADRAEIEAVSPINLAENFTAPVLLIHGNEDTVVPSDQSEIMERALERAGKNVKYIEMKGDDHSLVDNESRKSTLREIQAFLNEHIK